MGLALFNRVKTMKIEMFYYIQFYAIAKVVHNELLFAIIDLHLIGIESNWIKGAIQYKIQCTIKYIPS